MPGRRHMRRDRLCARRRAERNDDFERNNMDTTRDCNERKDAYEAPRMTVVRFDEHEDIVCTSGLTDGGFGTGGAGGTIGGEDLGFVRHQ